MTDQELQEQAEKWCEENTDKHGFCDDAEKAFIQGAKWMQERDKSHIAEEIYDYINDINISKQDAIIAIMSYSSDKWISVSEQIPPLNTPVLVFMKGKISSKPLFKVDELVTKDEWRNTSNGFILKWQPLPSPPKD